MCDIICRAKHLSEAVNPKIAHQSITKKLLLLGAKFNFIWPPCLFFKTFSTELIIAKSNEVKSGQTNRKVTFYKVKTPEGKLARSGLKLKIISEHCCVVWYNEALGVNCDMKQETSYRKQREKKPFLWTGKCYGMVFGNLLLVVVTMLVAYNVSSRDFSTNRHDLIWFFYPIKTQSSQFSTHVLHLNSIYQETPIENSMF